MLYRIQSLNGITYILFEHFYIRTGIISQRFFYIHYKNGYKKTSIKLIMEVCI